MPFLMSTNPIITISGSDPIISTGGSTPIISIQDSTINQKGAVQLEDSTTSTSVVKAATPNSVKNTHDHITTISGALKVYIDEKSVIGHDHDERYYTETELNAGQLDGRYYTESELDAGQLDDRYYTEIEIDGISDALQLNIDGKSDIDHLHDDRYYTESEVDNLITTISGKLDDHNEMNNLDYDSSGHIGFASSDILSMASAVELTLVSGTVTRTQTLHRIDTEGGVVIDDLDTILGGVDGDIIIVRAENGTRTVTLKDGTGNLKLGGRDLGLIDTNMAVMLFYSGVLGQWLLIGDGGGSVTAAVSDDAFSSAWDGGTAVAPSRNAVYDEMVTKSDLSHLHDDRYYTESEIDTISGSLNTKIDGKSDIDHIHDSRYYTETEVNTISGTLNTKINEKSDADHLHDDRYYTETELNNGQLDTRYYTELEVDGLITTVSGKLDDHNEMNNLDYVSSGHTGFQPAGDYATDSELTTLSGALKNDIDGKSNIGHLHDNRYYTESETDTISGSLNLKKMDRIVSVDNEIARFDNTEGDVQGYSNNAPTISDDGDMQVPGGIELDNSLLVGNAHNNLMVNKVTFDVLNLMTSPRFLNLMCEDPGAGTMIDVSGNGHDGTYNGTMTSEDRIKKVQGWAIDPDGINDFIDLGNDSDFSFGDGNNDSTFSLIIVTEIDSTGSVRTLISKWDETLNSEDREWKITLTADHKAKFEFFDESEAINQNPYAMSSVLGIDETHVLGFTYNGVGGADADDGIKIYDNGILDSGINRSGNQINYIAMEIGSTPMRIGSFTSTSGIASAFMAGNAMMFYVDGVELSEFDMWRANQLLSGLYSENGEAFVPSEQPPEFIFTIQTTGDSETFSLPLEASGTYDFTVDWGDDSSDDITVWNQVEVTHTYASAGTHEISITGTIVGWSFDWNEDCEKIYELKSWGPFRLGNSIYVFSGCVNLIITATDILDLTGITDLESLFDGCISLTTIPSINSWDFSSVINMLYLFYGATLFNQNISSLNIPSVTSMEMMLMNATSFDQDLGSLDISSVTDMGWMLYGVTLSTANYDALLIGWEAQAVQDDVNFHGGNSKYSAGAAATARQALIDDHSWNITDGGQV